MAKTETAGKKPPRMVSGEDRKIRDLTRVFKSLADESRIRILFLLAEKGEMSVTALGDILNQSQPAVSHHLTQLRNAGLIDYRRDGKFNYYGLNPDGVHELLEKLFPGMPPRIAIDGLEIHFKKK
jgi:ArsR family transcriptional regulator